jgi:hypothetical protein
MLRVKPASGDEADASGNTRVVCADRIEKCLQFAHTVKKLSSDDERAKKDFSDTGTDCSGLWFRQYRRFVARLRYQTVCQKVCRYSCVLEISIMCGIWLQTSTTEKDVLHRTVSRFYDKRELSTAKKLALELRDKTSCSVTLM